MLIISPHFDRHSCIVNSTSGGNPAILIFLVPVPANSMHTCDNSPFSCLYSSSPFVSCSTSFTLSYLVNFMYTRLLVRPLESFVYVGCTKSIRPLVSKNTIIYFDVWNPNPLQSSLLGNAHTSSSGPAIAGNISGKVLVESCTAGPSRSA